MNNIFSMAGKVAIVTGAGGYIGSRFSKALLDFGADVVAADKKVFKKSETLKI